jgi:hypothetical protein
MHLARGIAPTPVVHDQYRLRRRDIAVRASSTIKHEFILRSVANGGDLPTLLATKAAGPERRKKAMKKLIPFVVALLIVGHASAYAQGDHANRHRKHLMSSHAQMWGHGSGIYVPRMAAPSYYNDDPDAEGRTSG